MAKVAEETQKQKRTTVKSIEEKLTTHASDESVHLNRRDFLRFGAKVSAVTTVGTLAGLKVLGGIWNWTKSFKPKFKVCIYSDREIEINRLSERQRALIAKSSAYPDIYGKLNGYMKIDFDTKKGLARAEIRRYSTLLTGNVHENEKENPCIIERERGESSFTFVAKSPDFSREKVVEVTPTFLDNKQLLAKIVEATKIKKEDWSKVEKYFSNFYLSSWSGCRSYHGYSIPTDCIIRIKGDSVCYDIEGLEALTDGNRNLFAEYWLRRNAFDSYDSFKEKYDVFAKIRKKIKDPVALDGARGSKLLSFYNHTEHKFESYESFRKDYSLFADASARAEAEK